jgi:predicted metalloendopeptidase
MGKSLTRKQKDPKHIRRQTKKTSSGFFGHPGNDFYQYVNHSWLQKVTIPPTKTVFGVSEEIEKKIDQETGELLKRCVAKAKAKQPESSYLGKLERVLGTLALSVESADSQVKTLSLVKDVLGGIQGLSSPEDIATVLGEFTQYKISTILNLYGQYENKNGKKYTFTLGVGGLGLPDASFYFSKSLNRAQGFSAYKKFLKKLGKAFDLPLLPCIVKLERILAGVIWEAERETIETENTGKELEEEFRHIPFESFFSALGLPLWRQTLFFVESKRWIDTLNKLFHHLGLDHWRLLLSLEFLLYSLPWLPPSYSDLSFQFYRKKLRGQQEKLSRKEQSIYAVQQYTSPFFSRLYKEEFVDTHLKPKIESMVKDFQNFAKERLEQVEWLEPQTRKKAQEKVQKMRAIVAYPDEFEDHILPELEEDNVLFNLLELGSWQTRYEIQKLGQPITQRKEWDDPLFIVNAYYYEQANEMVIPSGVIQDPFYKKDGSLAWNYGGLGCIICHELTHAFDKEGKEYDPQGFQKKWWTPGDNRRYNEQTKDLISLYGKQRIFGLPVSGKKTLSENIADIGGMSIALDALNHKMAEMKLTDEERKKMHREFFTSYAVSWRLKEKKKKRIQALITDKHAPPNLRVNLVVSQFQEWYDAFDVKPGDKLFILPDKRIHIF